MWLITTLSSALLSTILWLFLKKKYRLGFLSLMLWGATLMIMVDHILGYEGGQFIEMETDGLVQNSTILGIYMLVPIIGIWILSLFFAKNKKNLPI